MEDFKLTDFAQGAGCGCKLSSQELQQVLAQLSSPLQSDRVIVGLNTSDDAGVYLLDEGTALVQTLDFFTPVVDDAFTWGRIAATNALSDVYAMGGSPITALNIVAWPRDRLDWSVLAQVLEGGADVLRSAGCALLGGHSIHDPEPKYGLSVSGLVDPRRLLTNAAGRDGDVLVLTKPLGTGVVSTASKLRICPTATYDEAVESMTTLNRVASASAVDAGVRCATDITGFGLVGHLKEIANASGVAAVIDADALPTFGGIVELIEAGAVSGGAKRNHFDTSDVDWGEVPTPTQILACDPQTSGGLLLAIAEDRHEDLVARLAEAGTPAWVVGHLQRRSVSGASVTVR